MPSCEWLLATVITVTWLRYTCDIEDVQGNTTILKNIVTLLILNQERSVRKGTILFAHHVVKATAGDRKSTTATAKEGKGKERKHLFMDKVDLRKRASVHEGLE